MRLTSIKLSVYLIAIIMQALGVALMLKSVLGASPYGILIANLAILLPITVGVATFLYNLALIVLTAILSKQRFKYESFIIMILISLMTDLFLFMVQNISVHNLALKIIYLMLGLTLIDVNKILFQLVNYPSPPLTDFFFAFSNRFKIRMNYVVKLNSAFNLIFGILISFLIAKPYNQVNYGTIISLLYLGSTHKVLYPILEKLYLRITTNLFLYK